jgi:hypothetical protein
LSHSVKCFLHWIFWRYGLANYLLGLALSHNLLDLCSWVSWITDMSHWRPTHQFFYFLSNCSST